MQGTKLHCVALACSRVLAPPYSVEEGVKNSLFCYETLSLLSVSSLCPPASALCGMFTVYYNTTGDLLHSPPKGQPPRPVRRLLAGRCEATAQERHQAASAPSWAAQKLPQRLPSPRCWQPALPSPTPARGPARHPRRRARS